MISEELASSSHDSDSVSKVAENEVKQKFPCNIPFPMKTFLYLNFPVGYDWLPCHSKFYILVRKERLPAPVASHLLILTNKAVFFLVSYVH